MCRGTVNRTVALRSPSILFRDYRNATNFYYEGKICEVNEPINKPWDKEPCLAFKLFSDRIKTTFCKVCLECGRSRLAFSGREDVAIGKVNKFLRDVLLWSRSVLLLLAPTTRKCDSSQWCPRLLTEFGFLKSSFPYVSDKMKRCTGVFKRNCCLCLTWYEGTLLNPASLLSRQASVLPTFAKKGPRPSPRPRPSPSLGLQDQPTVNGKSIRRLRGCSGSEGPSKTERVLHSRPKPGGRLCHLFCNNIKKQIQRYQNENTKISKYK